MKDNLMRILTRSMACVALVTLPVSLEAGEATPPSGAVKLSAEEISQGFRPVFNGVDLKGWHYRNPNGPKSWSVQDGLLVNTLPPGGHGTDLITDEKFKNFTVRYEYKIPPGANSGFYLRGRYEIQILDDGNATRPSNSSNGSLYSLVAPSKMASKKAGEWQTVEATIVDNRFTVILNEQKIIDNVVVDRPTGGELDRNLDQPGPIFLQGDHGAVTFRNIRVKPLP